MKKDDAKKDESKKEDAKEGDGKKEEDKSATKEGGDETEKGKSEASTKTTPAVTGSRLQLHMRNFVSEPMYIC